MKPFLFRHLPSFQVASQVQRSQSPGEGYKRGMRREVPAANLRGLRERRLEANLAGFLPPSRCHLSTVFLPFALQQDKSPTPLLTHWRSLPPRSTVEDGGGSSPQLPPPAAWWPFGRAMERPAWAATGEQAAKLWLALLAAPRGFGCCPGAGLSTSSFKKAFPWSRLRHSSLPTCLALFPLCILRRQVWD